MRFLLLKAYKNFYTNTVFITITQGELMKKISILALMSVFAIPAFASDFNVTPTQHQQVTKTEHGFLHGVQIGAGLSATSGLNGFIGYVNKDFDSFWAKRFGLRFDFATTKPVKSLINDDARYRNNNAVSLKR